MSAEPALTQKQREWKRLAAGTDPAPGASQAACGEKEIAEAEKTLAAISQSWPRRRRFAAARPGTPAGPGRLVRELREQARRFGVKVRSEEQFGLQTAGGDAPTPDLAAMQRWQVEGAIFVIQTLLAAKPSELVSVQCLNPRGLGDKAAAKRPKGEAAAIGDTFDIDPQLSIRAPGLIETLPVRVCFVGRTVALRRFLQWPSKPGTVSLQSTR